MEILGVGMSEFIFVLIIALIVLGPRDMQKAGRTIGRFLRNLINSDGWKIFKQTSNEIRTLPHKLIRDANEEVNKIGSQVKSDLNIGSNPTSNRPNIPPPSSSRAYNSGSSQAAKSQNANTEPPQQNDESDSPKDA